MRTSRHAEWEIRHVFNDVAGIMITEISNGSIKIHASPSERNKINRLILKVYATLWKELKIEKDWVTPPRCNADQLWLFREGVKLVLIEHIVEQFDEVTHFKADLALSGCVGGYVMEGEIPSLKEKLSG